VRNTFVQNEGDFLSRSFFRLWELPQKPVILFLEMSKTKFFPGLKEGCQAQKAAAWSSGARKEGTAENCTEKTLLSKN